MTNKDKKIKTVQYFSDEYIKHCKKTTVEQRMNWLLNYMHMVKHARLIEEEQNK